MRDKYEYIVIVIVIILMMSLLTGCKSVRHEKTTIVETPDGVKTTVKETITDDSFTLGGSEGDGKTLLELSIGNIN